MVYLMRAFRLALLLSLCVVGGSVLPFPARAQDNASQIPGAVDVKAVGKVIAASGIVSIEHPSAVVVQANLPPNSSTQSKVGDLIYQGDLIQTGSDGSLGIVFADGTSFTISKNAKMEVNNFVYDPKGNSNSSLMSLSRGTFTFIAGDVAHTGSMKVDTPLGTMGIRGTAPRVEISDDGTVKFSTLVERDKK